MGFKCGIIGLPNVGKSTLFNTLTQGSSPIGNYPFTTREPFHGVVQVPDTRLDEIARFFNPREVIPTTLEFVDIAGLVKGAHKGEGLGNQFLAHIREMDALAHVVRLFDDPDVIPHRAELDPVEDVEIIETEILLSDIEMANKQREKLERRAKTGDKKVREKLELFNSILENLNRGTPISEMTFTDEEYEIVKQSNFLTDKPVLFVGNIGENDLASEGSSPLVKKFVEYMEMRELPYIVLCVKLEYELTQLDPGEREEFMQAMNIEQLALYNVIQLGYRILNLVTFFTKQSGIVQAWTVPENSTIREAGRVIHSDFYEKFIKAEIIRYEDLIEFGSEKELREYGRIFIEGKDYIVRDGDIVTFKISR